MAKGSWQAALAEAHLKKGGTDAPGNMPAAHGKGANFNETPLAHVHLATTEFRSKLEASYATHLDFRKAAGEIDEWRYEPLTFHLAPRTTLTPDFAVRIGNKLEIHETKGFRREDAMAKLKIAAKMYPWFEWYLVEKGKAGWSVQRLRSS